LRKEKRPSAKEGSKSLREICGHERKLEISKNKEEEKKRGSIRLYVGTRESDEVPGSSR